MMKLGYKFAIIGFGEVGTTVSTLLNAVYQNSKFFIYDPSEEISGRILDFSHACVLQQNEVCFNENLNLKGLDFILYCAGHSNKKGESRETVSKINKTILHQIFDQAEIALTTKIIVVTNPVEKVTKWLKEILPNNLVVGTGTSLDTIRLNFVVAKKLKVPISEVNALILGEHGENMAFIYSKSYVGKKSFLEIFTRVECNELENEIKAAATKIRETEKATKFGVSECVLNLVKALTGIHNVELPVALPINKFYQNEFGIEEQCWVLSLPCSLENKEIKIQAFNDFLKDEKKQLIQALKSINTSN